MADASVSSGGVGFVGLLTILFIALKLTHVIYWSWPVVLSPIWITASFMVGVMGVTLIGLLINEFWSKKSKKKGR